MIGWRGPFTIIAAALLAFCAIAPPFAFDEAPPGWLRLAVGAFAAALAGLGLYVCAFTARRNALVRHATPRACTIDINPPPDDESGAYESTVTVEGARWRVPLAPRKAVRELSGTGEQAADCWTDPRSGAPVALRWDGRMLETIPVVAKAR